MRVDKNDAFGMSLLLCLDGLNQDNVFEHITVVPRLFQVRVFFWCRHGMISSCVSRINQSDEIVLLFLCGIHTFFDLGGRCRRSSVCCEMTDVTRGGLVLVGGNFGNQDGNNR